MCKGLMQSIGIRNHLLPNFIPKSQVRGAIFGACKFSYMCSMILELLAFSHEFRMMYIFVSYVL